MKKHKSSYKLDDCHYMKYSLKGYLSMKHQFFVVINAHEPDIQFGNLVSARLITLITKPTERMNLALPEHFKVAKQDIGFG